MRGLLFPDLPTPTFSGPFSRGHTSKATDHCFVTVSGGTRGPVYINDTGVTDSQVSPTAPPPADHEYNSSHFRYSKRGVSLGKKPYGARIITSACLVLRGNDSGKEGDWLRTKEKRL